MEREALSASRFCFSMGKRFEACHLGISSRRCAYPGRHTLGTYIICRGFTHPPHLVGHALSDVCSEFTSRCLATIYVATRLFFNTDGTEFSELPSGTFGYYGASLCDGRIKRKQLQFSPFLLRSMALRFYPQLCIEDVQLQSLCGSACPKKLSVPNSVLSMPVPYVSAELAILRCRTCHTSPQGSPTPKGLNA